MISKSGIHFIPLSCQEEELEEVGVEEQALHAACTQAAVPPDFESCIFQTFISISVFFHIHIGNYLRPAAADFKSCIFETLISKSVFFFHIHIGNNLRPAAGTA